MKYQRKETIGECVLYLGDNMEIMPYLDGVGAIVTDPPYGISVQNKNGKIGATSKKIGIVHFKA